VNMITEQDRSRLGVRGKSSVIDGVDDLARARSNGLSCSSGRRTRAGLPKAVLIPLIGQSACRIP
jgi:hypothetical protein